MIGLALYSFSMACHWDPTVVNEILAKHGFTIEQKLGEGGFACVFKVSWERYPTFQFAAKIMHFDAGARSKIQAYDNEIEALRQICHSNVIKIYAHFIEGQYHVQILEFCEFGSLRDMMRTGEIPLPRLRGYLTSIVQALIACHERGFVHNDIKPGNILIDRHGNAKLADFGASYFLGQSPTEEENTFQGSLAFIAPEMTMFPASHPSIDRYKTDVWALGITLFQLVTGRLPWTSNTRAHIISEIRQGEVTLPPNMDPMVKQTLRAIFVRASRRPTMSEVALLPFFKDRSMDLNLKLVNSAQPGSFTGRMKRGRVRATQSQADYSVLFKNAGRSFITGVSRTLTKSNTFGD